MRKHQGPAASRRKTASRKWRNGPLLDLSPKSLDSLFERLVSEEHSLVINWSTHEVTANEVATYRSSGIFLVTWVALALQTRRIDDNALKNAAKGTEWLTYGQSQSEQRHSILTQITPANISRLGLAWSFELGDGGGKQEGTPLFSNGIIYAQTNWSITVAVDARTGREIWRYDPKADRQTRMCCGIVSRGIALYEGKVLVPVVDGRIEALDAATGKLLWSSLAVPRTAPGEASIYAIPMAPRVAKGKVFIGNAGGEFPGFRGYVSAFDVNTGRELWKFYTRPRRSFKRIRKQSHGSRSEDVDR